MRRWMRDRVKRRNQKNNNPQQSEDQQQGPAPLQPTFLDRESWPGSSEGREDAPAETAQQPVYEAQPEKDPFDAESQSGPGNRPAARRERSRRRGRGGRGRTRTDQQEKAAQSSVVAPGLPIQPGQATGEAAEIDEPETGAEEPEADSAEPVAKADSPKGKKGVVVLAIGLPGSGKSSWFKRHNIIPLSSDLVRGLLFDDATEQRFQDLVFSSLRSLLRARLIAGRPMNFIDATNLSPKERHSWIKMAHDFGYEAHAVFFDVPTEICMERNRKRSRNVPDEVMLRMAQKLRPPKFDEGFAKVIVVRLKTKKDSDVGPAAEPSADQPFEDGREE
ncbi:MAG TPA: AAA family ATPase [Candidatus Saccharimonadales bacterium]|nr:AAA family ATPase [Candidatus Saccharimonadales bacterium]